ncbi:branched-chain amino acid ABC transporter permease [Cryobacterium psychrophilum]|uniref:Branched-chain amino acid ABC transporter permease n=1 Tax=Cryobacterium psychrophilum TaxID=41988 RepID=A0A4Y8KU68_9MICO|nr:branched-chain amino acid ABC transporter permease [Cryobacterium psychrophilum]TDW28738.1 amino acid/amide ABC transporter membrane protein 1 (HAAT family) [Cryobacterium psychrophilum]TFD82393.1 branched-chain amino acid ABC transporter permease [Cryobacterium psychrophilum]
MQLFLDGIFLGSIYALFAIGFTLVFGILDRLNLAHAAVFTAGALIGIEIVTRLGVPIWLLIPMVLIIGAVLGILIERIAFRPLAGRHDAHFAGLISSIAFGAIVLSLLQAMYGADTRRFPADAFPRTRVEILGATVSLLQVIILVISVTLMVVLTWLVAKSKLGRGMRTIAENPHAAAVLGLNVGRISSTTFALSSALGAVAGVLFTLNVNAASLGIGHAVELKALAVIVVGGMGSLPGALVGGLILGVAEVLAVNYIGSSWRDMVAFGLLFLILILRPQGLFGARKTREV